MVSVTSGCGLPLEGFCSLEQLFPVDGCGEGVAFCLDWCVCSLTAEYNCVVSMLGGCGCGDCGSFGESGERELI